MYIEELGYENNKDNGLLEVSDLKHIFSCGEVKARKIMNALPCITIGLKKYISAKKLMAYLEENGEIKIKW